MKKVRVNEQHLFEVDGDLVNGKAWAANLIATGDRFYHLLHDGRSYTIEVLQQDAAGKQCTLRINGRTYEVGIQDPIDQLLDQMGLSSAAAGKMAQLQAPMPGLILDIRVQAGDAVQKGDPLMVLEAMKMENVLKAEGEGIVKNILVAKGQNVEKGFVMMEFE
ncbi:MAG TPA: biotin/lipoyl-binding protein [Chitinophagales bacterium]|nr:biotin/lipoyl-binding protein [Chitinophagales bacterium]HAE12939.1 acetyl-CoA carboxylase biotin carboxyl carrier protein subunit [Bacteroidota bacterium]MCB9032058.1 biotin/lipoyl-binding protein [Chitinophagales bacterium]HPE98260.1 biotin/lipoyl-binding protein [Chitinophagales bacterium]HPR27948.1 biotin/lipoyl-binding protein [Chitinophagales bacterium]